MQVYFAHPLDLRFDEDKFRILDELKSRQLLVYDPYDEEEKIVHAYGQETYWDNPNWDLARELWTKDLKAINKSDFLLAWIPTYEAIGTSKEMTIAYLTRRMYVQVISPILHPSFAVEAHQLFTTIDDFVARKPHIWKKVKKI